MQGKQTQNEDVSTTSFPHWQMSYMNVEKQSKTLSTTGSQWITREHHSEQLRFLARKTNIWSNTSHSHATILLLEPLVYGGEISLNPTLCGDESKKVIHFIEVNSTLPTRLWTPRNKGIKRVSREVLKPRPRLNSKLKNPSEYSNNGCSVRRWETLQGERQLESQHDQRMTRHHHGPPKNKLT